MSSYSKSSKARLTERVKIETAYAGDMLKVSSIWFLPTVKTGMVYVKLSVTNKQKAYHLNR